MPSRPNAPASWDADWKKDEEAQSSERRSMWDALDEAKFSYLREVMPHPAGSGLEVGCGSARLLSMLAGMGWETVGIDFTQSALDAARRRFQADGMSSRWARADCLRLPFADDSYDLVASTGLLEHFQDPAPVVREMLRVLRPGGIFYSDIVPRKFSLLRSLDWLGDRAEGRIFERPFSQGEIDAFMASFTELHSIRILPAGVFPPRKLFSKHIAFLHEREYAINRAIARIGRVLDGSRIAGWIGFYYFVTGRKGVLGESAYERAKTPGGAR